MQHAPIPGRPGRVFARLVAVLMLLAVGAAVFLIVSSPPNLGQAGSHGTRAAAPHRPPPYWTVRSGDTFAQISAKTGVSIASLQAYNPTVDPMALTPGQRLNLWRYPPRPPKPKAKPPGPMFWVVRPGQSFGSIAASTGINIVTLEHLNPQIKPTTVQPGDRVRLRH